MKLYCCKFLGTDNDCRKYFVAESREEAIKQAEGWSETLEGQNTLSWFFNIHAYEVRVSGYDIKLVKYNV